ncbi:hypothetical protein AWB64_00464 [Caballeronia sordidicola]|uniref:Uncharacterized protein n=1 Tax=Caballeronia sordidicola TaxID=196367 RepID=A0A158EWQ9_CABSO|nr:hypothetical protein [Caballeronia sordidicola]SAL12001.1 hypothetical protein AWB64_00464 [Caballeronia sordidicola]
MADLIDFSNIGKDIDVRTGNAALLCQRVWVSPDAVATLAGMKNLIAGGDISGALTMLDQCTTRLDASGDPQSASVTRHLARAIRTELQAANAFAK